MNLIKICITREKHLDHMVKVVPFIVLCYAVQCFVIFKMSPTEFSTVSLSILGGVLALMIIGFISYDLKHKVELRDQELEITFLGKKTVISYDDIWTMTISEPGQSFSSLVLKTKNGKFTFYFIDQAEKIKSSIEERQRKEFKEQAA